MQLFDRQAAKHSTRITTEARVVSGVLGEDDDVDPAARCFDQGLAKLLIHLEGEGDQQHLFVCLADELK